MKTKHRLWAVAAIVGAAFPIIGSAEVDFVGDWFQPGPLLPQPGSQFFSFSEESGDRGAGPEPGDYAGLPIKEAVRYKAELYSPDWLSVPEHQCIPHPSTYQDRSPGGLTVEKVYDPITQRLVAYVTTGNYGLLRTIWMDGRPHPAPSALHTFEGFSTGKWVGNKLVVDTTHLKAGWVRRNGVAHTDRAVMHEEYVRHDNLLTIILAVNDPTYLDEPFVRSTDLQIDKLHALTKKIEFGGFWNGGTGPAYYKCGAADEIDVTPGFVPSFMPGKNTELSMFANKFKVPMEASLGGTATMYPDYMARLRQISSGAVVPQPVMFTPSSPDAQPAKLANTTAQPERKPAVGKKGSVPTVAAAEVSSQLVAGQVWMITVNGRNIAAQIGPEGVLVVNPGKADTAAAALAELRKIAGDKPVHIIVDTSSDPEFVGGNAVFAAGPTPTSQTAAIYAQENVGLRLAAANTPSAGTPTEAFAKGTRQIFFNDEPVDIIHVPSARTDGDVIVVFRKSDVVVAGGVIEDLTYPVIRVDQGGTLNGEVNALNRILQITTPAWRSEYGTLVIPAQGHIYDEGDVAEYRDAMTILRDRFADAIKRGQTLQQINNEQLALDYDVRYGDTAGPGSAAAFASAAYTSLSKAAQ